jgi:hypothetical protein
MPRIPDGHPDLQGNWTNATLTALQRPPQFAENLVLTKAEADVYEKQRLEATNKDRRDGPAVADLARGFNDSFYESGARLAAFDGVVRTSLIVEPPNGRLPPLTLEAQKRDAEARARALQHPADSAADRSLDERCLLRGTTGPPMFPQTYNNNYQIVQTSDYVMILSEMIHDVRIIPLDGRPHVPRGMHPWMGDSRGHWEGDALVIDIPTSRASQASPLSSEIGLPARTRT